MIFCLILKLNYQIKVNNLVVCMIKEFYGLDNIFQKIFDFEREYKLRLKILE